MDFDSIWRFSIQEKGSKRHNWADCVSDGADRFGLACSHFKHWQIGKIRFYSFHNTIAFNSISKINIYSFLFRINFNSSIKLNCESTGRRERVVTWSLCRRFRCRDGNVPLKATQDMAETATMFFVGYWINNPIWLMKWENIEEGKRWTTTFRLSFSHNLLNF